MLHNLVERPPPHQVERFPGFVSDVQRGGRDEKANYFLLFSEKHHFQKHHVTDTR